MFLLHFAPPAHGARVLTTVGVARHAVEVHLRCPSAEDSSDLAADANGATWQRLVPPMFRGEFGKLT